MERATRAVHNGFDLDFAIQAIRHNVNAHELAAYLYPQPWVYEVPRRRAKYLRHSR